MASLDELSGRSPFASLFDPYWPHSDLAAELISHPASLVSLSGPSRSQLLGLDDPWSSNPNLRLLLQSPEIGLEPQSVGTFDFEPATFLNDRKSEIPYRGLLDNHPVARGEEATSSGGIFNHILREPRREPSTPSLPIPDAFGRAWRNAMVEDQGGPS